MEVVALDGGKILTHGDFDPIVFAYHTSSPVNRVHWIGSHDTLTDYVLEKASIGSGKYVTQWNVDRARNDLRAWITELEEEDMVEQYSDVLDDHFESEEELYTHLHGFDDDPPENLGRYPTYSVFAGWAALHRLHNLLLQGVTE